MKKLLIICLAVALSMNLRSQEPENFASVSHENFIARQRIIHQHTGLYLSLGLGPLFGNITDEFGSTTLDISGVGAILDIKIGGSIRENLLIHGTLISNVLPGPTVKSSSGGSGKLSNVKTINESMIGGGLTYYMGPSNIFLSASAGIGNFSIMDSEDKSNNVSSQYGFSMQLKIGKEWYISKRWALGIGLTYGKTNLTNRPDDYTVEKLNSNRLGILLNATLN